MRASRQRDWDRYTVNKPYLFLVLKNAHLDRTKKVFETATNQPPKTLPKTGTFFRRYRVI